MLRTALGLGVVTVLMAAAGCTMCCHPNDYCGPVQDGCGCQACPSCPSRTREGSILSGMSQMPQSHGTIQSREMMPSQELTPSPDPMPTREVSPSPSTETMTPVPETTRRPARTKQTPSATRSNVAARASVVPKSSGGASRVSTASRVDNTSVQSTTALQPSTASRPSTAQRASTPARPDVDAAMNRQIKGDARPGDVPGSERIVSVTDRVVGEPADSQAVPQLVADSAADDATPITSKGWTARRPTPQIIR